MFAIDTLRQHYGSPSAPPSTDPFELILWENVSYLASSERRLQAFELLKKTVGTTPEAIYDARTEALERVTAHGILKNKFAEKLRKCARIALDDCDGDLLACLRKSPTRAKRLLRKFPGVGEPGADKILLFSGLGSELAPESNGLRVLVRLGMVSEHKAYARTYAAALEATRRVFSDRRSVQEAHLLLKEHGQSLCKRSRPACERCPLDKGCPKVPIAGGF
jgi:endonuclease-3